MNQFEYEMIKQILEEGAPALSKKLINSLDNLVNGFNALLKEKKEKEEVK